LLDTAKGWKRRHALWHVVTENNFKTTKYENLQTTSTFGDIKNILKLKTESVQADGRPKAAEPYIS
jgi:hypothetical protein